MSDAISDHQIRDRHWIIQFTFRCQDDRQRNAISKLGLLAHDVFRAYCAVVTPGSEIMGPEGVPIEHLAFRTRADARRFIRTWGGKLTAQPTKPATST